MHRLNPDCWIWSPRPPRCLLPQHSGSLTSGVLSHQEEEEEEEEEEGDNPAVCCYATGCDDVVSLVVDIQQTSEPPAHSGIPSSSGLTGRSPCVLSSQQPAAVIEADQGNVSQHFAGGCYWDSPQRQTQSCVSVYGQREPECVGHCWPGSPCIYYGVRRNLVVGVEVVEEVAVQDTVEVITEDVYTDDLLDAELLQEDQLYPT